MDARQRQTKRQIEPAWELVRRWPRISGADKLAWLYCWQLSRGGRERIEITPSLVCADQGTTEKTGATRINNLVDRGFLRLIDHREARRLVEVLDPLELARARKIDFGPDQSTFDFYGEETATSSDPTGSCEAAPLTVFGAVGNGPTAVPPEEPRTRGESKNWGS